MRFNDLTEIFETKYYGNTTTAWLIALGLFIAGILAVAAAKAFIINRLGARAKITATEIDDVFVDLLSRTRPYFYTMLVLQAAVQTLSFPPRVYVGLGHLTLIATLIQTLVWGSGLTDYFVKRYTKLHSTGDKSGVATIRAIGFAVRFVLLFIVVLIGLQNLGYDITALVAGLGIGGIAIALAIQNILGDLFAALSIMVDKPFVIGDTIAVDDMNGTVEHIGLKTTRVRSLSGEQLIFSNGDLLKSRVRNFRRMYERRVAFTIKVPYETPRKQLKTIPATIQRVIESHEKVRFDRSHFTAFADASLNFDSVYFVLTSDYKYYADVHQDICFALMQEFESEGIEFAYPKPTVFMRELPPEAGEPSEPAETASNGLDG